MERASVRSHAEPIVADAYPALRRSASALALAFAFALLAAASFVIPDVGGVASVVWLPNAVAFVWLLRSPTADWWRLVLAATLSNTLIDTLVFDSLAMCVLASVSNTAEYLLAAWLCRRWVRWQADALRASHAVALVMVYLLIAIPVSNLLQIALLSATGPLDPWAMFRARWERDAAGVLFVMIPGLLLGTGGREPGGPQARREDIALVAGAVSAAALWTLFTPLRFVYLSSLLGLLAVHFGALRAAVAGFLALLVIGLLLISGIAALPEVVDGGHRGLWLAAAVAFAFPLLIGLVSDQLRAALRRSTESEAQAQALAADLAEARERAEEAARIKGDFLANMSHEIRTPMNAVIGATHLLGQTALTRRQRRLLDMVRGSSRSLLAIVDDILDFSKIEANKLEIASTPFALDDVLRAVAAVMTFSAGSKALEIVVDVAPDVPTQLRGDPLRLQQVLVNLTGNAIKFSEAGEVVLAVECAPAEDAAATLRLCFVVRDTGIGISEAQLARLFNAFDQGDTSTTRRFGGTGLGLAISKRLVELMGGTIAVRSALGRGSEFTVELPFDAVPAAAGAVAAARGRVLLVEPHASTRVALGRWIRAWGLELLEATGGEQALDLLRAARPRPDVLLVAAQLPGLSGVQTAQAIRALYADDPPPVLLLGTRRDDIADTTLNDLGDAQTLLKPVVGSTLFNALLEAVGGRADSWASRRARRLAHMPELSCRRLLVVEDNALNQQVALGMLEPTGASVDVVGNGREAVDRLAAEPARYDLVLMDVQMPVMDGFSATRTIRDVLRLSVPVIAMSAGVMQSEREQCTAAGMNDFVAKPVDPAALYAVLQAWLCTATPQAAEPEPTPAATAGSDFDPDQLLRLVGGKPELVASVETAVAHLVERGLEPLRAARAAVETLRRDDAARALHTLRGSVGTLGARRFADAVLELENAIRTGDEEALPQLYVRAETELTAVLRAAAAWQATRPQPQGA